MAITRQDVLHVSRLARLELSEAEVEKFTFQLGNILDYVSTLNEIDTRDVPPTSHVLEITNVFREDEVADPSIGNLEGMAPSFYKGHFRVPKVIE
ncbi:MAG: Asp-tRNA(Asn)/Glu-tRNA(Gln) amidotransferase subunit GatC [Nitrospinota bacterium]